ncbi:MAG: hypothetical protein QXO40_04875 [Candidatus Aenigmatarchaeota archaeon]
MREREFFKELMEKLYKLYNNFVKIFNRNLCFISLPSNYSYLSFNNSSSRIDSSYEILYSKIKEEIAKIYDIPGEYLNRVKIYVVDNLPSLYSNTIVFGRYRSVKDFYGRICNAIIYIPKWLFKYPKKLIETIAHELTHYIQDLKGKIKRSSYQFKNFSEYFNSEEEKEARTVGKYVADKIYKNLTYNLYGSSRMYFL